MTGAIEIVAEVGVNHDGDMSKARALIDSACDAGANYVKFQSFFASKLASPSTPKVGYQQRDTSSSSHFEMLSHLELNFRQQEQLKEHCDSVGIEFCSTPYDVESLRFLVELGVPFLKIASADIVDVELLLEAADSGRRVVLSTGMSTLEEISRAVGFFRGDLGRLTLLHAISEYPARMENLQLGWMSTLREKFQVPVGFSDHSSGVEASIASVVLGAQMLEKHLTLSRTDAGPDHFASIEPDVFSSMVQSVRNIERALAHDSGGSRRLSEEEESMRKIARKSVVYQRDLATGHEIHADDLSFRRPGDGLMPYRAAELLGRVLAKDVSDGAQAREDDFLIESNRTILES